MAHAEAAADPDDGGAREPERRPAHERDEEVLVEPRHRPVLQELAVGRVEPRFDADGEDLRCREVPHVEPVRDQRIVVLQGVDTCRRATKADGQQPRSHCGHEQRRPSGERPSHRCHGVGAFAATQKEACGSGDDDHGEGQRDAPHQPERAEDLGDDDDLDDREYAEREDS